jgi:gluconolactonase
MASPFIVHDPEFLRALGDAPRLDRVVDVDAHEGPVYVARADALYFTSLPTPEWQVAIRRIALDGERFPLAADRVETLVQHTRVANGMTLDAGGQLLVCEQGSMAEAAAISRVDPRTGARSVVVDNWGGLPLNSPNDVVVRSDGSIWFTDPSYGHLQGFRPEPQAGDHVYRWDPRTGMLTVVADDFVKPNGLAFSPDESLLYVTDSGANQEAGSFYPHLPHHVIAYDVDHGRHLVNRRLFAVTNPGFPDGLKVDDDGRVYASSLSGVQVFSPLGDFIGEISLPGAVNFCFGGRAGNVLFIATGTAVWAATLAVPAGASLAAGQIRSGSETKELPHDRQPHAPDHR